MEAYQSRVLAERRDLDEKIAKLHTFVQSEAYRPLDIDEQRRLRRQLEAMKEYSQILTERIHAFGPLKYSVMVNGIIKSLPGPQLSYEELVELAGFRVGATPTATYGYIGEQNAGGIMHPGDTLPIVGNEYFTVVFTGNA